MMSKISVQKLSKEEIEKRGILNWSIWEKEVSRFPWTYDSDEECLILEGKFLVETDEKVYSIEAGDFVTFQAGLTCVWNIQQKVRKHYNFR